MYKIYIIATDRAWTDEAPPAPGFGRFLLREFVTAAEAQTYMDTIKTLNVKKPKRPTAADYGHRDREAK